MTRWIIHCRNCMQQYKFMNTYAPACCGACGSRRVLVGPDDESAESPDKPSATSLGYIGPYGDGVDQNDR